MYPIPKFTRVLQSYDIPAPVILCSRPDPYSVLNPVQSVLPCNDILEGVIHHSGSDPIKVLESNVDSGHGLDPGSAMDIDPWIASRSDIEFDTRITDLTAIEHAGGTLGELITIVSTTSSDSSASPKVGAPEFEKDVVVIKIESENHHSKRCDVCKVFCNSQKAFKRHLEGKLHLKNLKKLPVASPIKQEMPLPVANKTLEQVFDKKNELLMQNKIPVDLLFYCSIPELGCANQDSRNIVTEQVKEPMCLDEFKPSNGGTQNGHGKLNDHKLMWCDVCKVSCSDNKSFELHISGKQHLKNVKLPEKNVTAIIPSTAIKAEVLNPFESDSTRCELCGISCTSRRQLNIHISCKKHQKNLKKSGNLNRNSPAPAAKPSLQDPMIEEGEIVEEGNKRKPNIPLTSDNDDNMDKKKQKMMEEEAESGVLLTCQGCNVVCKGIPAFNSHLASPEHSAMVMKQINCR